MPTDTTSMLAAREHLPLVRPGAGVEVRRGHQRQDQRARPAADDGTNATGLPPSQVVKPAKVDLWDSGVTMDGRP
jgi:hypothetical protein